MRTSTKLTTKGIFLKNNLPIVFILLFIFQFSFAEEKYDKNSLANDALYSSFTSEIIKTSLEDCQNKVVWLEGIELLSAPLICSFYQKNNFNPVWTDGNDLTSQSEALIELFKDSYKYGFEPINFDITTLEQYSKLLAKENQEKKSAKIRVRFEFLMTNSIFTFMLHLTRGTEFSNTKDVFISGDSFLENFPGFLTSITASDNIVDELLRLQPDDSEYISIQSEMEKIVIEMVAADNTLEIPEIETDSESFSSLFSYLFIRKGIIQEETNISDSEVFISNLIEFQNTIGIRPTGKVDAATRRAVTNIIWSRYTDLAKALEKIRQANNSPENSFFLKS